MARGISLLVALGAALVMAGSAGDEKTKEKCLAECKQSYLDRVSVCNDLYNMPGSATYHNTESHKTCLNNAKTNYDNCRSTCE